MLRLVLKWSLAIVISLLDLAPPPVSPQMRGARLGDYLARGLHTDITFQLEDGTRQAHKPLLMARCDMMQVETLFKQYLQKKKIYEHVICRLCSLTTSWRARLAW